MTEQLTREQVLNLKPCRKSNWLVHMIVIGNKAWKCRRYSGGIYRSEIEFSPESPFRSIEEIEFKDISESKAIVQDVPDYFRSISAAWEVVEKMKPHTFDLFWSKNRNEEEQWVCIFSSDDQKYHKVYGNVASETISKAALLAVMGL